VSLTSTAALQSISNFKHQNFLTPQADILQSLANNALHIAQRIAVEHAHRSYGPPHLLKALLHKDIGLIPLLDQLDKDSYYIEEWADVRIEHYPKSNPVPEPEADDALIATLTEADYIRIRLNKATIDPLCLLAAVSTPGVGFTFDQLKTFPLSRNELLTSVAATEGKASNTFSNNGTKQGENKTGTSALTKYCIRKTGEGEAIIGRDKELRTIAEILCRRSKPNVMIVGEPGVGKTALADAFAQAIARQQVPALLQNAALYELDNGALLAGASYKGEVEDRLNNIFKEIKQHDKAILFVDEIHTLLDKQGSAAGAVNILKPELARGEITLIGATTPDEYRKHIESDEAFNRRFELLKVEEPDDTTAFQMLKQALPPYATHHNISVEDEVITESIRLARRYVKNRKLPDAAIDLIDRSMAALRLMNDTGAKEIESIEQQINTLATPAEGAPATTLANWLWCARQLQQKLSPILLGHIQSETNPLQLDQITAVQQYLNEAVVTLKNAIAAPHTTLRKTDVAAIVAASTGIPVGKLQSQERDRLLNMETILRQRVVGQDHAIRSIADAILESRSGLGKPGQPVGSFFFLGPTGTGKTELAKSLAEFLFQDESFMIRFDMSEFKEEHAAALLYGAPPGYVGYEEGGLLVNKIRQQPYAVVLFDEIEKAHQSVFDVFLQIMDEGKLHDKLGKEGDFSNAVVIFTSNIGSQYIVDEFGKGVIPSSNKLMEIMNQYFRPEFLGRLTEIIPFAPMKEEMALGILGIQLKSVFAALEKQGITLTITDEARYLLAQQGFTPAYGARPLAGVIRNQVRRPLSRRIINGEVKQGSVVELGLQDGELVWGIAPAS
jgi:ATP-dependent Clp protease ATP-binding subunit ClpA